MQLRHALAKEYEDLGGYAESFAQLRLGAAKRRQHLRYDVGHDVATVDWIIDAFRSPPPEAAAGCSQDAPIFIVGLPRSGTTLVERILGSHCGVPSAGELDAFALALVEGGVTAAQRRCRAANWSPARPTWISRHSGTNTCAELAARFRRGRFIDKMPLNYLYCGLIMRALPQAKIIHLTRHPMAVCYAMYKTLFKDGYPFSYDLHDIGCYYLGYRRLMDHWRATLPGAIHDLSYEQLIADQAGETRKLLNFCGLEWQDACLDFHRNAAATTTASASQIRRPLYASSVSQWRQYAAQLAPLHDHLTAAGIDL